MKKSVVKSHVAAWAVSGTLTLLSMSAGAQTQSEQTQSETDATVAAPGAQLPQAGETLPVEDGKIDQFADAYIAVQKIQTKASEQLSATTDAEKASEVKQKAETQMIEAVERTGLQLEEFNEIVQAMANDATLRERVSDRIGERKQTS